MNTERLKSKILDLLVKGELTAKWRESHRTTESAEELLEKIRSEKEKRLNEELIAKGKKPDAKVEIKEVSDNDKPFEIPKSWKWCRLGDICFEIKRGKSPLYTEKSDYLVFAQKCNLKQGGISLAKALYLDESKLSKYPADEFMKKGDIVINSTGTGTLGRVGFFNMDLPAGILGLVPDGHITKISPMGKIDTFYIYSYLKKKQPEIELLGSGSTNQKELKPQSIKDVYIPLPPLEEQKELARIAETLFAMADSAAESCSKLEDLGKKAKSKVLDLLVKGGLTAKWRESHKASESAEELLEKIRGEKEKRLNEELMAKGKKPDAKVEIKKVSESDKPFEIPESWKWCRLGDIAETFIGLTYKPADKNEIGTFVLRSSNIQNNKIDLSDEVRVSCDIPEKLFVEKNDILMCSRNGSRRLVGKSILIKELPERMCFGAFMTLIKSSVNTYLTYFLKSALFFQQVNDICNTTTINQITLGKLNNFILPLPPLEEQKEISRIAEILLGKIGSLSETESSSAGEAE